MDKTGKNTYARKPRVTHDTLPEAVAGLYERIETLEKKIDKAEQEDRLLTMQEAVDFLKIGRGLLYKKIKNEGLPSHKIGGARRFYLSELNKWIQNR
jgi:excisionase family DNA binding protein